MKRECSAWMWDQAAAFSRRGGYPVQELAEAAIQKFCRASAPVPRNAKSAEGTCTGIVRRASLSTRIETESWARMKTHVWDGRP